MAVIDNLNTIKQCKEDIKQAIINKGVDMTDVPFTGYATKISEIQTGGGTADYIEATQNLSSNYYSTAIRVPDYTFAYCPTLTSVDLPNVWEVCYLAFFHCQNLTTVNLPSCERISHYAFQSCAALTEINIPNCSYFGAGVFYDCSALQYVNMQNCSYVSHRTFENCINLTSVDLPNCTRIDSQAFSSCTALSYIDLPNCTEIYSTAFRKCTNLTQINIPRCSYISHNAFNSCLTLTQVDLTNTYYCQLINSNAFLRCPFSRGEGSIYIHAGQVSLYQNGDFWSWYSACFVPVGDPNQTLLGFDGSRLYGDTSVIYDNYENAFHTTRDMITTVDLPNVVEFTDKSVFQNCINLIDVNLPNCVSVGGQAFASCTALTSISLPNCVNVNTTTFENCTNLIDVNLPNCEYVGRQAFASCTALTSISLPNCVRIYGSAFENCTNLIDVNLPMCVNLDARAFEYCNMLSTLYIGTLISTVCLVPNPIDLLLPPTTSIFVPASLVSDYQIAIGWSNYASQIFGI